MNAAATSFVLGVKGTGGYDACRQCQTQGELVSLNHVDKRGVVDLEAQLRKHSNFVEYAAKFLDPHPYNGAVVNISSGAQVADVVEEEDVDVFVFISDYEDESAVRKKLDKRKSSKRIHIQHPIILVKIPQ